MTPRPLLAALAAAALLLGGCSPGPSGPEAAVQGSPPPPGEVYAALGASETVGVGTSDPTRQSFAQLLYLSLPRTALFYNFGLPGETTAAALKDELPGALAVRPTVVSVWFNVDDLVAGVSAADYEARLDQLVGPLTGGGAARVLPWSRYTTPPSVESRRATARSWWTWPGRLRRDWTSIPTT
jgi:hypothetical protein